MTDRDPIEQEKLDKELREHVERKARFDGDYAIAWALLQLADELKALGGTILRRST